MRELAAKVRTADVQQAIRTVRAAQKQAALSEYDLYGSEAAGLSIFMPPRPGSAGGPNTEKLWRPIWETRYRQTRFAKDTGWDEFLATQLVP